MKRNLIIFLSGLLAASASAEESLVKQSSTAEQKSIGISSSHMQKINASTDILGRHNSKVAKTPTAYIATSKSRASLARTSNYEPEIAAITGRYENYKINNSYVQKYWFHDIQMDSATYVQWAQLMDNNIANMIHYQSGSNLNTNTPFYNYYFSTS
jgi:hypothetical protein